MLNPFFIKLAINKIDKALDPKKISITKSRTKNICEIIKLKINQRPNITTEHIWHFKMLQQQFFFDILLHFE